MQPFPSVSLVLQGRALKGRTAIPFGVGRVKDPWGDWGPLPRRPTLSLGCSREGFTIGLDTKGGKVYNAIEYLIEV